MSAIYKAQQEYKLANGDFTSDLRNLSVQFDQSINCSGSSSDGNVSFCQMSVAEGIMMEILLDVADNSPDKWRCMAIQSDNVANGVCKSFGGKVIQTSHGLNYYSMP